MSVTNEILTGVATIKDWLGDGGAPVTQAQADQRAETCLRGNDGKECPHLTHPRWWEKTKGGIAFAIKEQLEAKSDMKLVTELDQVPRLCNVCGCCMPLKAWVPIEHIAAHTPEDLVKKFPPYCRIRQEIENL